MLQDLIERWLRGSARGIGLRFPAPLEFRFEADTRRERSRTLAAFGAIGLLTGLMLYPRLLALAPDIADRVAILFFGVCMPLGLLAVALVLLDPRPLIREATMAIAVTLYCLCVLQVFVDSKVGDTPVFVGCTMLALVYITVGVQLRFLWAVASTATVFFAFVIALQMRADMQEQTRQDLLILAGVATAYALLANWRLERQFRRNYLVSLREQLQRHDLALRNRELDELSRRDSLTGLSNRRAYDTWLARAWQQAEETGGELGLIVIDIDRFKLYNDFYGHAAGDACLQKIARCLGEQLRGTSDLIARLGGEEFAVLLPRLSEDVCADVAERLRRAVSNLELPHVGLGRDGLVSVSAGVACRLASEAANPTRLFAAADAALYQAKAAGRNRVGVSPTRLDPAAPAQDSSGLPSLGFPVAGSVA